MNKEKIIYLGGDEGRPIIPILVSSIMCIQEYDWVIYVYTEDKKLDLWSTSLEPEDGEKLNNFLCIRGRDNGKVLINPGIDQKNQLDWYQMKERNDIRSSLTELVLSSGKSIMLKWKYLDCLKYFGKNPGDYSDPKVYRLKDNRIVNCSYIRKILIYSSRHIKFYKVFTHRIIEEKRVGRKTTPEDIMKQFRLPKDSFSWKKDGPRLLIGTKIVEQKGEK